MPARLSQGAEPTFLLMHELGIAESALEVALAQATAAGATRVLRMVIRVGALSGVDPEALRFAFTAILPGTPAEGAAVQIDSVAAVAYCPDCRQDFVPDTRPLLRMPDMRPAVRHRQARP